MKEPLGWTGIVVLSIVIVLLLGEDILILYNTGVLPAIEFLILDIVVIGILAIAIREARRRIPP